MKKKVALLILFASLQLFFVNIQIAQAQKADTVRYKTFSEAQETLMQSYEKLMTQMPELQTYMAEVVVKGKGFKLKTLSKEGYHIHYKQKQKKGSENSQLLVYRKIDEKLGKKLILAVKRHQGKIMYLNINEFDDKGNIASYELSPGKFYRELRANVYNEWEKKSFILLNINNL